MYTIKQIKEIPKITIILENQSQWQRLKNLGFEMTTSY